MESDKNSHWVSTESSLPTGFLGCLSLAPSKQERSKPTQCGWILSNASCFLTCNSFPTFLCSSCARSGGKQMREEKIKRAGKRNLGQLWCVCLALQCAQGAGLAEGSTYSRTLCVK